MVLGFTALANVAFGAAETATSVASGAGTDAVTTGGSAAAVVNDQVFGLLITARRRWWRRPSLCTSSTGPTSLPV